MKNDWKAIRWLYDELPGLVASGTIPQNAADSLKRHYGEIPKRDTGTLTLTVFSIIGALLVGGGLIMIMAHNWDSFGRVARTAIAIAPLAAGLCALAWMQLRKETRPFIIEPLCAFQTLALGAAMGIIGQTYNTGGDLSGLLFVWCIAAIPLAYIFDSVIAGALCFAILCWRFGVSVDSRAGNPLDEWMSWAMLAACIPYLAKLTWKERGSGRAAFLGWIAAISLTISAIVSLNRAEAPSSTWTEIWQVAFPCFFSALFLAGAASKGETLPAWRNPLRTAGAIGAGIMAVILSLDAWKSACIFNAPFTGSIAMACLLVAICLGGTALLIWQKHIWELPFALFGLITCAAALLLPYGGRTMEAFFSAVTLLLGVLAIASGIRSDSFGRLNGGLLLIAAWMIAKFFESDLSFLFKGMLFIVIGIAFIAANVVFVFLRRQKKESSATAKEVAP